MPILPGVDGVLFELLLVTPHVGGGLIHGRPNHNASKTSTALRGGYRSPYSLVQEVDADNEPSPGMHRGQTGEGSNLRGFDGSVSTDRISTGGVSSDNVLVGAVALLLSEVAANWRTMESPLFDRAGCVVGKIKMVARVEGAAAANKPKSTVCEKNHQARRKTVTTTGVGVETAVAAAAGAAVPPSIELKEGELFGQEQSRARGNPAAASATACCNHGRRENTPYIPNLSRTKELMGRLAGDTVGTVEPVAAVGLGTVAKAVAAHNEIPSKATILYRGLCLPFCWFRSSTPAVMDAALRETLGEFVGESQRLNQYRERARWGASFCSHYLAPLCPEMQPLCPDMQRTCGYSYQ